MRNPRILCLAFIGGVALLFTTSLALSWEAPPFPDKHPPTAVSDTWDFGAVDTYFNIYVWRTNGHVWIGIEPIGKNPPFVIGGLFDIVQNGVQLTGVPMLQRSDGSLSADWLYVPTIFRLVKLPICTPPAMPCDYVEDRAPFTLYYHNANLQTYSLDVPAESASLPMAAFTANPTSGRVPLAVSFTDQSTGNITSWSWNFGDGATSTEQNPTHTYRRPGIYTVSLTVTGTAGSDSETRTDLISAEPGKAMPWIPLLLLDE